MRTYKKKGRAVGIIAEDDCDVDSVKVLLRRITNNDRHGVKKFVGKGCGKIKKKCNAWATQLEKKGCSVLIAVHDRDTYDRDELYALLLKAIEPCPIKEYLICIPVQEIESWFLSDPDAIKVGLNLRVKPKIIGLPEDINSPKEYLGEIIYRASRGETIYINTKHNEKIAKELSIDKARKRCPSFIPFFDFVQRHLI